MQVDNLGGLGASTGVEKERLLGSVFAKRVQRCVRVTSCLHSAACREPNIFCLDVVDRDLESDMEVKHFVEPHTPLSLPSHHEEHPNST